ncbi:MAG: hypothetical protein WAM06_04920 [Methyloceanibacter sp.]
MGIDDDNAPTGAIELRVNRIDQLFHSFDPFPFLDKEVEDYIVSWARMHANDQPIKIIIHLPENEVHTRTANELAEAFAHYFGYHADLLQHDLDELYRDGRRFLAIGMTILVSCIALAQVAGRYLAEGPLGRLLEQSLPILGWVANWRPLEIFLYDWWPLARRRDLYRHLATATVETKSAVVPEIGVGQDSRNPADRRLKEHPRNKRQSGRSIPKTSK